MENIKVIIVDDHKIFRQGIKALLQEEKGISLIEEAGNRHELMALLNRKAYNLLILDVNLGQESGIDLAAEVKSIYPSVNILALSMHFEKDYIIRMLESGATGYILKNTGREELITAIYTVAKGDTYLGKEVSESLIEHIQFPDRPDKTKEVIPIPLTPREIEVLKLIAQEFTNSEIAEKLFISIRTVDTHRRNLLEKLGLKNTAGLVKYAIRQGLIES
jgi:DNA-binding NarL/FixJ family response regulator